MILRLYLAFVILLLGLLIARREGERIATVDHARATAQHIEPRGGHAAE